MKLITIFALTGAFLFYSFQDLFTQEFDVTLNIYNKSGEKIEVDGTQLSKQSSHFQVVNTIKNLHLSGFIGGSDFNMNLKPFENQSLPTEVLQSKFKKYGIIVDLFLDTMSVGPKEILSIDKRKIKVWMITKENKRIEYNLNV